MAGKNIIQKQSVQVEMDLPSGSPFDLQVETSRWCNEKLTPAIERKLEKYAGIADVIRLENICIDVDDCLGHFTEKLAERIAAEIEIIIENKLKSAGNNHNIIIVSETRTIIGALLFFLQQGYFPWWSKVHSIAELNEKHLENITPNERIMLNNLLLTDPSVRKRLVTSVSHYNTITFFCMLSGKEKSEIEITIEKLRILSLMIESKDLQLQLFVWSKQEYIYNLLQNASEKQVIKSCIIKLIEDYKIPEKIIRQEIQYHHILENDEVQKLFAQINREESRMIRATPDESETVKPANSKKHDESELHKKEGIYINNSGLVLIAPFLPRFFENLGIIENSRFNSSDLALAILQWLVTGNDHYEESDLVLPKILCGMEPEEAVIIIPSIPESFKKEADTLLQSVIEYWSILKNTSIQGLRESFLQRDGKLSKHNNEWYLQVEQKPYDMLLEHLPWNISMTRLSWMPWMLRTEWVG